jgi:hypothetical protein
MSVFFYRAEIPLFLEIFSLLICFRELLGLPPLKCCQRFRCTAAGTALHCGVASESPDWRSV